MLLAWLAIVPAFFVWQMFAYRGLPASIAEWEFDHFGVYFPIMTTVLLSALFAIPCLYLWRYRQRPGGLVASGTRFLRFLASVTAVLLAGALTSLLLALAQPSEGGTPARVVVSPAPAGPATPREGATILSGLVRYDRVSAFDDNLLLARHTYRLAPVQPIAGDAQTRSTIRYFAELPPVDRELPDTAPRRGVLVRNGLPGEIVQLYRYAGYRIEEPHYVLYADNQEVRWPYMVMAAQFLLAALVFAIGAVIQWRRVEALKRRNADSVGQADPAEPLPQPAG